MEEFCGIGYDSRIEGLTIGNKTFSAEELEANQASASRLFSSCVFAEPSEGEGERTQPSNTRHAEAAAAPATQKPASAQEPKKKKDDKGVEVGRDHPYSYYASKEDERYRFVHNGQKQPMKTFVRQDGRTTRVLNVVDHEKAKKRGLNNIPDEQIASNHFVGQRFTFVSMGSNGSHYTS